MLALLLNFALSDGSSQPPEVISTCEGSACGEALACGLPDCPSQVVKPANARSKPPTLTAKAVAVLEQTCGAFLYQQNADRRLAPASTTKIMTALVAAERFNLAEIVDIQVNGPAFSIETDSTIMGLEPGMRMSVRDLLVGLLLVSGGDAALALAQHYPGGLPSFVERMNSEARQLGLRDTRFNNPHGLDDSRHYTSAHDLALMGQALMARPELAVIAGAQVYQPAWDGPELHNQNQLLNAYPGALGVKIGYTPEAGHTIVAAARKGNRQIVASLLGSTDLYTDTIALLDWAFQSTDQRC